MILTPHHTTQISSTLSDEDLGCDHQSSHSITNKEWIIKIKLHEPKTMLKSIHTFLTGQSSFISKPSANSTVTLKQISAN